MSYSSLMRFDVGMVRGSCIINYRPPQYEPPNPQYDPPVPEEVEFTHVSVNNKYIPFENINDVLFSIMLEEFYEQEASEYR